MSNQRIGFWCATYSQTGTRGASSERCKTLIVSFIFLLQDHHCICIVHARFSEFGRAVVSMRLEEQNSPLRYFGFSLDQAATFKTMLKDMRSQVWAFWMNPEMRQQRQDLHLLLKRRHQPQVWRFWHGTQAALFGLRSWTLGFRKAPKSSRSL